MQVNSGQLGENNQFNNEVIKRKPWPIDDKITLLAKYQKVRPSFHSDNSFWNHTPELGKNPNSCYLQFRRIRKNKNEQDNIKSHLCSHSIGEEAYTQMVAENGQNWQIISENMGVSPTECENHWRVLQLFQSFQGQATEPLPQAKEKHSYPTITMPPEETSDPSPIRKDGYLPGFLEIRDDESSIVNPPSQNNAQVIEEFDNQSWDDYMAGLETKPTSPLDSFEAFIWPESNPTSPHSSPANAQMIEEFIWPESKPTSSHSSPANAQLIDDFNTGLLKDLMGFTATNPPNFAPAGVNPPSRKREQVVAYEGELDRELNPRKPFKILKKEVTE